MCKIFTLKLELLIFYLFPLLLPSWRASPSSVVDRVPSLPELLVQPSLLAERRLALVRHASRPSWVLQLERLLVLRRRPKWEINLNLFMCMSQRTATTIAQWGGTPSSLIERNWEFLGAKLFLVNKRSALVFLVCYCFPPHLFSVVQLRRSAKDQMHQKYTHLCRTTTAFLGSVRHDYTFAWIFLW